MPYKCLKGKNTILKSESWHRNKRGAIGLPDSESHCQCDQTLEPKWAQKVATTVFP